MIAHNDSEEMYVVPQKNTVDYTVSVMSMPTSSKLGFRDLCESCTKITASDCWCTARDQHACVIMLIVCIFIEAWSTRVSEYIIVISNVRLQLAKNAYGDLMRMIAATFAQDVWVHTGEY